MVIAGPCSAETEDQVLKIAHDLKDTDVSVYRAGIWKPELDQECLRELEQLVLNIGQSKKETGLLTALKWRMLVMLN